MCGLGGGGQALVRSPGGAISFFDFREQAPLRAHRDLFAGKPVTASTKGWLAAAVPGHVAGFETLHAWHGRRRWDTLLQPAIRLAAEGHTVSYQRGESGEIFPAAGERLVQPDLAHTLRRLAAGARDFYHGEIARQFCGSMERGGGIVSADDLARYSVDVIAPHRASYRGLEVVTASGSSAGGICLLQMLALIEKSGFARFGWGSAAAIHELASAMRRAFADRAQNAPGEMRSLEHGSTTHFSVLDSEGTVAAVTVTLNGQFGSGVVVPGLGFLLNNNMDNFATRPGEPNRYGLIQAEAHSIQPGKRPPSSMTPTIVLRGGEPFLVLGTPGGPTIPNSILQALTNVVDFEMNSLHAITVPRIHHQWMPDELWLEPGFSPDTIALLEQKGHRVVLRGSNNDMTAILCEQDWIQGAVDPRREGKALGY
jgi:gamma-glutamyltranspeptidase/glutathione hydrolase